MSQGPASPAIDHSIPGASVTGSSQVLFPAADYNGFEERWINNPSATATIWVNLFGNSAVAASEVTLKGGLTVMGARALN